MSGEICSPTDLGSLPRFLRIFDLDSGHEASQRHQKNPRKDGFKLCRLGLSGDFVIFFLGGRSFRHCTPLQRENCNKADEEDEELQIRGWFRGIWSKWDLLFEKNKSQSVLKQTAVSNFLFLMPSFQQQWHVGGQAQAWRLGHLCPLQSRWHLGGERCGR